MTVSTCQYDGAHNRRVGPARSTQVDWLGGVLAACLPDPAGL